MISEEENNDNLPTANSISANKSILLLLFKIQIGGVECIRFIMMLIFSSKISLSITLRKSSHNFFYKHESNFIKITKITKM